MKQVNQEDYISLTDMARGGNSSPDRIINNWLRNRGTLELLALWEKMANENFKPIEFDRLYLEQSGKNNFAPSVSQFIEQTSAISLISKRGRNGGTYAHRDIAFAFGSWISPAFQLLLIREFQRLKTEEAQRLDQEWNYSRFLTKVNYSLHTDSIKKNIMPRLGKADKPHVFASEADLLNMVVFGLTAKEFREQFPEAKGNLREGASIRQLTVLANMESMNSYLIEAGASQEARFAAIYKEAQRQLEVLEEDRRLEE